MSEITRAYAVYKGQQYNASYIHIQSNSMPLTQRATRRSCTPPTGHMEIS